VLILRLKQAETAMADDRLDEAFDIVQSEQVRQHRRGQKLIGRLAEAYVRRGQGNLESERVQLALLDCNKAEKLAGNTAEVARLRSEICSEMEQRRLRNQHRSLKVAQAREQIDNGWLSAGEQILKDADVDEGHGNIVKEHAAVARLAIDEAVAKANQALSRNDLCGAIDVFLKAGVAGNQNDKVTELGAKLKALAVGRIRENISDGRIDIAQSVLQMISPLANGSTEIAELGLALNQCRQAAGHVAAGQPRLAVPLLRKVKLICPAANWLKAVTEQSRQAADLLDELAAGPLGLDIAGDDESSPCDLGGAGGRTSRDSVQSPKMGGDRSPMEQLGSVIPPRFVLEIDGVGGFLVVRDQRVTVGPVSSSEHPTVGLIADPNMPVASIERVDEDYFLRSSKPVQVNSAVTTEKLLVDEDKIALSPRCRMKFNTPNPASTTATLSLSSARLGRGDIRRVILMDRDIVIGPTMGSHVQAKALHDTVTLFAQGEKVFCAGKGQVMVDGKPAGKKARLALNRQITVGEISMVLTEVKS